MDSLRGTTYLGSQGFCHLQRMWLDNRGNVQFQGYWIVGRIVTCYYGQDILVLICSYELICSCKIMESLLRPSLSTGWTTAARIRKSTGRGNKGSSHAKWTAQQTGYK